MSTEDQDKDSLNWEKELSNESWSKPDQEIENKSSESLPHLKEKLGHHKYIVFFIFITLLAIMFFIAAFCDKEEKIKDFFMALAGIAGTYFASALKSNTS